MASQSRDGWVLDRDIDDEELSLARMIHEHFSIADPLLRQAFGRRARDADSPRTARVGIRGLLAGRATRLSDFETNRHEECGLAILLISITPIYSNNVTHTVSH